MNCRILILFFIAFIFEDITTSPSTNLSSKYDITKNVQSSIQSMYSRAAELWKFLSNEEQKPQDITFNSKVGNTTYVCDLSFCFYKWGNFSLNYHFINSKVVLTIMKCKVRNKGWIIESSTSKCRYFTDHEIYYDSNIILESDGSSVNVSRGDSYPLDYLIELGDAKGLSKPSLIKQTKNKLVECISPRIKKFALDLSNYTRTISTSNHPDFLQDEQQNYYLIPNISLICFDLRNVTIKGFSNFHSLGITKEQMFLNLRIENIGGEMVLDYGSEVETPMKLNFVADYFTISSNLDESNSNAEIGNYRVFRTTQNTTLTDEQSKLIIQRIESEMASSLVWRANDQQSLKNNMESSGGEITISVLQHSDLETKKKALKKWIPFN